ncbi:MAG TPA: hypothetical protein VGO07_05580 [Candidatus Saccharimonadales bacterium]|jgi:hypothetical protein|nr:hypothetical protein [Candidatus Saccharimonadales bacterium]
MNNSIVQWKQALMACCVLLLICSHAQGQTTATGKLTVSGRVQGSLGLVFNNNPAVGTNGFCPLTNAGTNNVGLDMGTASYTTGDSLACVTFFRGFGFYLVSSSFDVVVTKANVTSPNYQLAASLSTTPPANVFWNVNFTLLSTTFTTIQAANNYAAPVTETLGVIVNQNVPQQTLFETINFLATAN